jgi:hypothetical protein
VDFTLENNGDASFPGAYYPANDVFLDAVYMDLEPSLVSTMTATLPAAGVSLSQADTLSLLQLHTTVDPHDETKNFSYTLIKNVQTLTSGSRTDGWIDLSDTTGGVTMAIKNFWQNYPKSIEVHQSKLSAGLWPDYGQQPETRYYASGNYFFSGTWHKTHTIQYYFHSGQPSQSELSSIMAGVNGPLFALAQPSWYADTQAWGLIAPRGLGAWTREAQSAIDVYEKMVSLLVDPNVSSDHIDFHAMREAMGKNNYSCSWYGWEDFGDLMHLASGATSAENCGPSAMVYDWPYIAWLQLVRTGDTRFYTLADVITQHSVDLDQHHSLRTDGTPNYGNAMDGVWMWETGKNQYGYSPGHHMNFFSAGNIISHTWNGGYVLGYLLTGDQRFWEAAVRSANASLYFWFDVKNVDAAPVIYDQTRSQGWTILMLTNLYKVDGNMAHLTDALKIFTDSILYTEQSSNPPGSGGKGYILNDDDKDGKWTGIVTFLTYPLEPLAELHYHAKIVGLDISDLESYYLRSLDWLKNYAFGGGIFDGSGKYSALTISYSTDPSNPVANTGGVYQHNPHVAGAFAYGFQILKDTDPARARQYLDFARALFKDVMFYRRISQANSNGGKLPWSTFFDPSSRSPVQWEDFIVAPKEIGYIGRGGQIYLNSEYRLDLAFQVSSIEVIPLSASIGAAQTQQLSAAAKDDFGNSLAGLTYTWASSDSSIVTVDGNGLVTAIALGTATITASVGGVTSNQVTLIVTAASAASSGGGGGGGCGTVKSAQKAPQSKGQIAVDMAIFIAPVVFIIIRRLSKFGTFHRKVDRRRVQLPLTFPDRRGASLSH